MVASVKLEGVCLAILEWLLKLPNLPIISRLTSAWTELLADANGTANEVFVASVVAITGKVVMDSLWRRDIAEGR